MPPLSLPLIFVTAFVVGLSGALFPGPLLAMNIAETARRGFWAGPILVGGHGITEVAMMAALTLGLSRVLEQTLMAAVIGIGGGLFLLYMSYGLFRTPAQLPMPGGPSPPLGRNPLMAGALVSLANPYWFVWWATIGSTYVIWALSLGAAGLILFYLGHILSDLSWYSFVSLLISRGRRMLSPRVYQGLLRGCGAFLLALGGYFIYSGVSFLA
jgi:threonine/homoserine/homoserine lactone efflux protein